MLTQMTKSIFSGMALAVATSIFKGFYFSAPAFADFPVLNDPRGYLIATYPAHRYELTVLKNGSKTRNLDKTYLPPTKLFFTWAPEIKISKGYFNSEKQNAVCSSSYDCGIAAIIYSSGTRYSGRWSVGGYLYDFNIYDFEEFNYTVTGPGDYPVSFEGTGQQNVIVIRNIDGKEIYRSPEPPDPEYRKRVPKEKPEASKDPAPCNFKDFVFKDDILCEENATRADGQHTINNFPFWWGDSNYNWKPPQN